jgi:hypothetical protein
MIRILLPPWFNDPTVPTVRTFYVNLLSGLETFKVAYELLPDFAGVKIIQPSRIGKFVEKYRPPHLYHEYETGSSYQYCIKYHSREANDQTINVKISYLPEYFYFDRTGFSGWAEIANTRMPFERLDPAIVEQEFTHIAHTYISHNISKYPQADRIDTTALPEPYVFLATQVEDDIVAELADVKTFDLIRACIKYVPASGLNLVIKRHPKCQSERIGKLLEENARTEGVHLVNYSIHDILPQAAAVIVVNSGVGFEALLHQKPVVAFGHSDYHWVTTRLHQAEELQKLPEIIAAFDEPQRQAIRQFVVYYLQRYLVEAGNMESLKRALKRFQIL